eukprot:TRINITY_DN32904_c0_g1_i1.p2 TRINITY_DN32904_c0_g1~~TRINITY_DN32904_c0_g1_i1.p2  ORF type:complete len:117 (-),score=27.03 TRINITY_DN32904_c0_g1_i1:213-563(-)
MMKLFFFFSSRRRHTRCREVSWARRCVQETGTLFWEVLIRVSIFSSRELQRIELFFSFGRLNLLNSSFKRFSFCAFSSFFHTSRTFFRSMASLNLASFLFASCSLHNDKTTVLQSA